MPATAKTVARAAALLLVAFLSLRGAIGVWRQFTATEAPPAAPIATSKIAQDPGFRLGASPAALPDEAAPPPRLGDRQAVNANPVSWHAIETSASFVEGYAGPVVAAFIDLDCGYCSQLWRRVRAPLAAGQLRMRWIPVAVLTPDGAGRAAALLRAADPVAALAAHESRAPAPPQPPSVTAIGDNIAANNALLAVLTDKRLVTPLLVARGANRAPRLMAGLSADLPTFLAEAR